VIISGRRTAALIADRSKGQVDKILRGESLDEACPQLRERL